MRKISINIFFAAGVTILLLLSGCASGIINLHNTTRTNNSQQKTIDEDQDAKITCYIGGVPYTQKISYTSGVQLKELFTELAMANAHDPDSSETQRLQQQILLYAEQQGLLPRGISADKIFTSMGNLRQNIAQKQSPGSSPLDAGTSQQFFCNFVSTGEGSAFPIIILPRFIPIIMGPIPRLFVGWKTSLGVTSCGGLISRTGFIASGPQQGLALGFWGIGFSIFLPPVMAYGMFGYALYAKVTAAEMDYWPPNNPPEITATYPLDGAMYIPLSTTELSFHIGDLDGDLMSYSVTTDPDVGGGNGNLKPDGTYTVPISGLKSNTEYTWSVTASDGKDTVEKEFTFTTEAIAPIISDIQPKNGAQYVPVEQAYLSFHLRDPQGDLMDYIVETSPYIGSGNGSGVGEGDISIPISGLEYFTEYHWFVNATDGINWTNETYTFTTLAENQLVFEPSDDSRVVQNHPDQLAGDIEWVILRSLSGWEVDSLVKFNIGAIPSNVTIQYATIQLYYFYHCDGNAAGNQVNTYRITSDWNEETVTWNNQPSYVNEPTSSAWIPQNEETWMLWDVTSDVIAFYNDSVPNQGWRFVDISGEATFSELRSKEYSEYHPLLIIGYE